MFRLLILVFFSSFLFHLHAQDCKIAIFNEEQIVNEWMEKVEQSEGYILLKKYAYQLGEDKVKNYEQQVMKFTDGTICYSITHQQKVQDYILFLCDEILCFEDLSTAILDSFLMNFEHTLLENINQEILRLQEKYHVSLILKRKQIVYYDRTQIQDLTSTFQEELSDLTIPFPNKEFKQLEAFDEPYPSFTEFDERRSIDKETKYLKKSSSKKKKQRKKRKR